MARNRLIAASTSGTRAILPPQPLEKEWPEGSSPGLTGGNTGLVRDLGPAHQDRSGTREDPAGQETIAITNPSPSLAADLAGDALPGCLGAAAHQGPLLDRSSESTLSPQALELEHCHERGCCRGCASFSPFPAPRCPSERLGAHSSRWAIRERSKINPPPWALACLPGFPVSWRTRMRAFHLSLPGGAQLLTYLVKVLKKRTWKRNVDNNPGCLCVPS
nr:uncharacterized protein encoded by LINC01547 isoform X1 [Pan paniscus]